MDWRFHNLTSLLGPNQIFIVWRNYLLFLSLFFFLSSPFTLGFFLISFSSKSILKFKNRKLRVGLNLDFSTRWLEWSRRFSINFFNQSAMREPEKKSDILELLFPLFFRAMLLVHLSSLLWLVRVITQLTWWTTLSKNLLLEKSVDIIIIPFLLVCLWLSPVEHEDGQFLSLSQFWLLLVPADMLLPFPVNRLGNFYQ